MNDEPTEQNVDETRTGISRPSSRKTYLVGAAVIAVLATAGVAYWLLRGSAGGGQPVSAPRTVTFDNNEQTSGTPVGDESITLEPEQAERIGIKIETVGETLSSEAMSASATGVVQSNAYRDTPVISLVGGIMKTVGAELGQNVGRGQVVATVFSDELAASQSRYLALQTEAQTARQNYDRAARLVKISPVSNAELDQAIARLKAVQAELEENRKKHDRTARLLNIGAASREEFEQVTTKLRTSEADVEEARKRHDRAISVALINPVSRSEFEQAAVKRQSAESDLAVAKQRLLLLGLSRSRVDALRSPSQVTSELPLASPISGTVTKREINLGQIVEANKPLLTVTDLSSVWVITQVYEKDLSLIRNGTGASITTDAYPGRVFRGHVTYIDPNINTETRTAQVRVELANPGQMLKIGMYVNAAFGSTGMSERTVPVVPSAAVQSISDRQIVFLATEKPNVFLIRTVKLGNEADGKFIVLQGINVGDRVVTSGSFLLKAELAKSSPSHH